MFVRHKVDARREKKTKKRHVSVAQDKEEKSEEDDAGAEKKKETTTMTMDDDDGQLFWLKGLKSLGTRAASYRAEVYGLEPVYYQRRELLYLQCSNPSAKTFSVCAAVAAAGD